MYLAHGYTGHGVRQLQRDLNLMAYRAGEVDGIYGDNTQAAVTRLQRYNGLVIDGIYGDQSDAALEGEIKEVQKALVALGYSLEIDGMSGPQTEGAVRDFQGKHGLAVDAIVGGETAGALKLGSAPESKPVPPPQPSDRPLSGAKIYLCAGHGGSDPGAVGHGMTEAERALTATFILGKMLQDLGANVRLGRTGNYNLSLYNRAVASDDFGADIYVAWHFNAFGDSAAHGCEMWYYSTAGSRLAGAIQSELVKATGLRNRGIKQSGELYELRAPEAISVLMEPGFITNAGDAAKMDDAGLAVMAKAIAEGVVNYFK